MAKMDARPTKVKAAERLRRLNEHLLSHPLKSNEREPSWASAVEEIELRRDLARIPVEDDPGYLRQKKAGKLWVRERIDAFAGQDFEEIGSCTGTLTYHEPDEQSVQTVKSFVPSNNVFGWATLRFDAQTPRRVMVLADDFSLRGGHADGGLWAKSIYAEQAALDARVPMIRLLDGSSGGGSVKTYFDHGRTYVPPLIGFKQQVELLATCPVASALLGPVVGLAAMKTAVSHFSVMTTSTSQLFAAGPPIVKHATYEDVSKDALGGPAVHSHNGSVDNIASDELDAFDQIKRFLSYLPTSNSSLPPFVSSRDPPTRHSEELLSIIPRRRSRTYDIRRIVELVVDAGTWFEIGRTWGASVIVGFARLGGHPVGVVSSDCKVAGGTLTAHAARKIKRHIDLCETFGVPILNLVDMPGIAVGTVAEQEGTVREATAALVALYQATIPVFTVILRRVFGVAGGGLVDFAAPANQRVAWPSGDWGSLPLAGGVEAAFKGIIEKAKTPEAQQAIIDDLTARLEAIRSPMRTAETFGVEEVIDPRETRPRACAWASHAYANLLPARLIRVVSQSGAVASRWRP